MTVKKQKVVLAKTIRQATGLKFVDSLKIAKAIIGKGQHACWDIPQAVVIQPMDLHLGLPTQWAIVGPKGQFDV